MLNEAVAYLILQLVVISVHSDVDAIGNLKIKNAWTSNFRFYALCFVESILEM